MANVNWAIANTLGVNVGEYMVDEDQDLPVPHMTDPSGTKRAGDLVVGDYFNYGNLTVKITADLNEA